MLKLVLTAMLLTSALFAQVASDPTNPPATPPTVTQTQVTPAAQPTDDLSRMSLDLDHMDGLLNNMSSEIEFLHDQNLQILLRTNAQMWTMLLRDMRQQLARERQRQAIAPARDSDASNPAPPQKPKPH